MESKHSLTINKASYQLCYSRASPFQDGHVIPEGQAFFLFPIPPGVNSITGSYLKDFRKECLDNDEAFQPELLKIVVFCGEGVALDASAKEVLADWQNKRYFVVKPSDPSSLEIQNDDLVPGPHCFWLGKIWEVWRRYQDPHLAMITCFEPSANFAEKASYHPSNSPTIFIPLRCYKSHKPLRGLRVVVKDNVNITGIATTFGARAWAELHSEEIESADCIKTLVEAGAFILGKTKLQAWAIKQPASGYVEYSVPINPRGDRYQDPAGSSHGSGVAVAAYEFIDAALAGDMNGSCRFPAVANGCFAIRPTKEVVNMEGVVSFYLVYDVLAAFTLKMAVLFELIRHWYGDSPKLERLLPNPTTKYRIVWLTDYQPTSQDQWALTQSFIKSCENKLQVTHQDISLQDLWRISGPEGARNIDLSLYMKDVATYLYWKESCPKLEEFREKYETQHGYKPFVNDEWRLRMDWVQEIDKDYDECLERRESFQNWFLSTVVTEGTICIIPLGDGEPKYVFDPPPPFLPPPSNSAVYISVIAGTPEVTVPVGETKYHSKVTGRSEPLPVCVSVITRPGTDLDAIKLVQNILEADGRPANLMTGRSMTHGDNWQ